MVRNLLKTSLFLALFAGCTADSAGPMQPSEKDTGVKFLLGTSNENVRPFAKNDGDISTKALEDARVVVVTIADTTGKDIFAAHAIDLYPFGDAHLSHPIPLAPGSYLLHEFLVLNAAGEVIYATPLEGSDLAHLVIDPLPIEFSVTANAVATVQPEVLGTEARTPQEFGYTNFVIDADAIVEFFDFQVAVFSDGAEPTSATLIVVNEHGAVRYRGEVMAGTNVVPIRGGDDEYQVILMNDGYATSTQILSQAEMLNHAAAQGDPLVVMLGECAGAETSDSFLITSQEQLEVLRGYIRVGDLVIDGTDVVNVDALACLRVAGRIDIRSASLDNLSGLNGLREINDSLNVQSAESMGELNALHALEKVRFITVADSLISGLYGFGSLVELDEIGVVGNEGLQEVAFYGLRVMNGALVVSSNGALTSLQFPLLEDVPVIDIRGNGVHVLNGFPLLQTTEDLLVRENGELEALHFPLLPNVPGALVISDNASLGAVDGFLVLESVGSLEIARNGVVSMLALPSLWDVLREFVVTDNLQLPTCDAEALLAQLNAAPTSVEILGNAPCAL